MLHSGNRMPAKQNTLDHKTFTASLLSALQEAGANVNEHSVKERLGLDPLAQHCEIRMYGAQYFYPLAAECRLTWVWDALLAARTTTGGGELSLRVEVSGRYEEHLEDSVPLWLVVHVDLRAGELGVWDPMLDHPLPPPDALRQWRAAVLTEIGPLFPCKRLAFAGDPAGLTESASDPPEVQIRCDPDGHLRLVGVRMHGQQGFWLPRRWEIQNLADPDPLPDLADFARRVTLALDRWDMATDALRKAEEGAGR